MFNQAALRGFVNTLTVQAGQLNATQAQALLVRTAEQARDRVLSGQPKPSGYRQVVDGKEGAALNSVRPDGTILFAWQYLGEIARDTYGSWVNRSPRQSGRYIGGLLVFVNGVQSELAQIGSDATEVKIVASEPYSRRLEVGKRKDGTPFVRQVAPHIAEETAIVARKLYGDLADIQFGYVDLSGAYQLKSSASHRRVRGRLVTQVQYPAITIRVRTA